MVKVSQSVVINRPLEEVFNFVSNPDNASRWINGIQEMKIEHGGAAIRAGHKGQQIRHYLGKSVTTEFEITKFEKNKEVSFKVTSGPLLGFRVAERTTSVPGEDVESGTLVTYIGEGELKGLMGLMKLAEPFMVKAFTRQLTADFATLKDILESKEHG